MKAITPLQEPEDSFVIPFAKYRAAVENQYGCTTTGAKIHGITYTDAENTPRAFEVGAIKEPYNAVAQLIIEGDDAYYIYMYGHGYKSGDPLMIQKSAVGSVVLFDD